MNRRESRQARRIAARSSRRRSTLRQAAGLLLAPLAVALAAISATGYSFNYAVPAAGGCPVPTVMSTASPIPRRWSTSLPASPQTIFTAAAQGTTQQTNEIQQAILDSFSFWTGVTGSMLNAAAFPAALAPLAQTSAADACANDQATNLTGDNTICFNQSTAAFTPGVLSLTQVFAATAAGQMIGAATSVFPGQILEADIEFRNDGQATFATPAALSANPNSYDLESLLIHELGHFFGFQHSPIWRAVMSPFAPSPGAFWGPRPTPSAPDGPLRDDDRTGLRVLYPDPSDSIDIGLIAGRVLAANPLSLAGIPQPAANQYVTGIFGANVVAVDANTGEVIASALAGWSCPSSSVTPVFDGSYRLARLPLGRAYNLYVEPLDGVFTPADFGGNSLNLCSLSSPTPCATPAVNTNFTAHQRPQGP